ncbi:unnamed protein product, partial [Owenia fusiformis]
AEPDATNAVQSGSKDQGEAEADVGKTVAQHYNKLQEAGLDARTQSRIFYLRNFNNWTKSMLIGDYLQKIRSNKGERCEISVLDLGSGKGGDLLKWKKGRIDKLICADIAETSVEQAESRFKDMGDRGGREKFQQKSFQAEFIVADCTKERLKSKYKDPETQFDLVSCQFAFHYCFESYAQADMMLRNAGECLRPGGYFIGTTPNSAEIVRRLKNAEGTKFGNEVYSIEFENNDKEHLGLFGEKYNFHLEGVVDCPEFLVYIPLLEKLAMKYNLKLVEKKGFEEYFKEHITTQDGRALIGRMQALEPYPADDDVDLMGKDVPGSYTAAQNKVDQIQAEKDSNNDRRKFKVGTLSQSEWEAATVYLAFAFQKQSEDDSKSETQPQESRKRTYDEANAASEAT